MLHPSMLQKSSLFVYSMLALEFAFFPLTVFGIRCGPADVVSSALLPLSYLCWPHDLPSCKLLDHNLIADFPFLWPLVFLVINAEPTRASAP